MSYKKLFLASFSLLAISTSLVNAAYKELDCSSDPVFAQNSCNQCFEGWSYAKGSNIGFLTDVWENTSSGSQILFKDEQDMPNMVELNGAVWNQVPSSDNFWEYTLAVEAKYDETEWGYILKPGESVDWIQSKTWYAYNLAENSATKWANIGLLKYPIVTHAMTSDWGIEVDWDKHVECVLFKSAKAGTPPKQVPQTGPENLILIFVAMLLGFGILKMTRRTS